MFVSGNLYDRVAYPTFPRRQTHPDRLAAVATLFGLRPAPISQSRVLEIGCGSGGNLIPMAYSLRESIFTGVDLAPEPIAAARQQAEALELSNLSLHAMDFRDIGPQFGDFDYIIAHGLYSWIPAEARDALLAVSRDRLAPNGVAFISYNVYPGRHLRQMLREMMLFHTRELAEPGRRIETARAFLHFLRKESKAKESLKDALDAEIQTVLANDDGALFHDDLAPVNDPVYFRQFAEHAMRHRLQYVGDAELHQMFDQLETLDQMTPDFLDREQYLDFLKARRFRQTILCRDEVLLQREPGPEQMDAFLFAAPARFVDGQWEGAHGVTLSSANQDVGRVAQAIGDVWPLPASFADLLPYASSPRVLRQILLGMTTYGFVSLHVHDFPCEDTVTPRPRASRLAQLQAATSPRVANLCHDMVDLDETGRRLLLLLDGTRDHAAIAGNLGIPPADLPPKLQWMAQMALLVG